MGRLARILSIIPVVLCLAAAPEDKCTFKGYLDFSFSPPNDVIGEMLNNWRIYRNWDAPKKKQAKLEVTAGADDNAAVIKYKLPKKSWAGMSYIFGNWGPCGPQVYEQVGGCGGIRFEAKGNARIRFQMTEGYECPTRFGELYHTKINVKGDWKTYEVPISAFKLRKDYQMTQAEIDSQIKIAEMFDNSTDIAFDPALMNKEFDTDRVHALTLEMMCRANDTKCKKGKTRTLELRNMHFF